jgi:hypothetical protein
LVIGYLLFGLYFPLQTIPNPTNIQQTTPPYIMTALNTDTLLNQVLESQDSKPKTGNPFLVIEDVSKVYPTPNGPTLFLTASTSRFMKASLSA